MIASILPFRHLFVFVEDASGLPDRVVVDPPDGVLGGDSLEA